ncbi:MAG TPA: gliding motility protein GldC [Saprospiraceae bacterium]|nr:gliding motility protein GldC [Saprospiraceae bacterium]
MQKKSEIKLEVQLDDKNVPEQILWQASDHPDGAGKQECKAVLLSLFDMERGDTLKIDLWTKDMQVIEMDRLVYQTLRSLADSYATATNNLRMANEMQKFAQFFGEETEIIKRP